MIAKKLYQEQESTVKKICEQLSIFDTEVTPISESELQDILYADFGLTIPFPQSVDSVEDNVFLELDFITAAQ